MTGVKPMSLRRHFVARLTELRQLVFGRQMADPVPSLPQDMPHIFIFLFIDFFIYFWVLCFCRACSLVAIVGFSRMSRPGEAGEAGALLQSACSFFYFAHKLFMYESSCWFFELLKKQPPPPSAPPTAGSRLN